MYNNESPSITHLLSLPTSTRSQILRTALQAYPSLIPSKLQPLDETRYKTIPSLLESQSHLTKPHLLQLLEWKLSHGKFRPTLKKLVDSNSPEVIEQTTSRALATFKSSPEDIKTPMDILTELRGIGPATASLVLSCADPEGTVFFGDEVAAWVFGDWGGKLKYSLKEYLELWEKVREAKGKLELSAVEMERVGYVFGKRVKGIDGIDGEKGKGKGKRKVDDGFEEQATVKGDTGEEGEPEMSKKKAKVKEYVSPPPAGTRRSTRSNKQGS